MGFRDSGNSRGGFGGSRGGGRSFGGGGRSFGGDRGGFSRDRPQRREMFDVTCTQCSKECQVPFKPTGSKPVLCSDCFSNSGGNSRSNSSGSSSDSFGQLSQINAKLDKILQVLQDLELVVDGEDSDEEDSDEDMPSDPEVVVDSDTFADEEENAN
ncbi:MAG: CxxC-x17-CxxC domain-containing protein [Candidatus Pacearchaeota archaeon]